MFHVDTCTCSSYTYIGFGNLLAKQLHSIGATVFAGCLDVNGEGAKKLKTEGSSRLHVLQMDITKDKEIQECAEYVEDTLGKQGKPNALTKCSLSNWAVFTNY